MDFTNQMPDLGNFFCLPVETEKSAGVLDKQQYLEGCTDILNILSLTSDLCTYIYGYVEKKFIYFDRKERLLCGYSEEEIKEMGIGFFEKIIHPEDLSLFYTTIEKGFDFFNKLPLSKRKSHVASYDWRVIMKNGDIELHNYRFYPLVTDEEGNLHYCFVQIHVSTNSRPGNFNIYSINDRQLFVFCRNKNEFVKKKIRKLIDIEKKVLMLMAKGYTVLRIEKTMLLKRHTVNYYQQSIMRKMGVKNSKEAIFKYTQYGDML